MTTATLGIAVKSSAGSAAVDLDKLTAASVRAEASVEKLSAATARGATAASNMSLNSANIAAQLQDVAVSAQMGMNPLQVALQQGTQLSAVLNQVRAGGMGVGAALATSFASIVNPVSLVTIGLIGLSTVALQALGSITGGAGKATDAIEKHTEAIADIVKGYEAAEDVAKEYASTASRLPLAAIEIRLGKSLQDANREVEQFRDKAANVGVLIAESFNPFEAKLGQLLVAFSKGQISANELLVETTRIANTDMGPFAFAVAGIARDFADGAQHAAALENSLVNITHALAAAASNGGTQIGLDSFLEGQRSAELHQIELDALKAKTPAQERDIAMRRERLKLVDEEITEALREQKVREAGELAFARANARAGKSATKDFDQWSSSVASFQKRIDMQQLEIDLFGQSTYEIERQKAALDLLNEAKQAGIPITSEITDQINQMATEYATATAEMERLQYQQQQIDQLNNALASGFANLFIGIIDGSQSAEEGIANLLKSLGNLLINQAFQSLFAPTALGGGGFNPFGFMMGPGRASGGPVHPGMIYPVNENTPNTEYFAPAVSGTILTADQVRGANDNSGGMGGLVINNHINLPPGASPETAPAFAREFAKELRAQFPDAMAAYERNTLRRAGRRN